MNPQTFSRGARVIYTGRTCPAFTGLMGTVTGVSRNGFINVRFDGDPSTTKCCEFNLSRVGKQKRRA